MPSKNPWPVELRQPIIVKEVAKRVSADLGEDERVEKLVGILFDERLKRVEIIYGFFGSRIPQTDADWMRLLVAVCEHWKIPAFDIEFERRRGRGATRIWTDLKHCELFADVQKLASGALSEHGACKYIAANPTKFGQRYQRPATKNKDAWSRTIHRQYASAKQKIKNETTFRAIHFSYSIGLFGLGGGLVPDFGPTFIEQAIERYGFKR
jgi:hypothetical protein